MIIEKLVHQKIIELRQMICKINSYIEKAPTGGLKIKRRNGNVYYYHQYKSKDTEEFVSRYITRKEEKLAKALAQKGYFVKVRPLLEKELHALEVFEKIYNEKPCDDIYEALLEERKRLVAPVRITAKEQLKKWQAEIYEPYKKYSENQKYETENGEMVRSKSELIIANILHRNRTHFLYKYERPLELKMSGKPIVIHPDFTILNISTGKIIYWEHAGRMDDVRYINDFVHKMNMYMENKLFPGEDVIVTFETMSHPLNIQNIKRIVGHLIEGR